MKWFQDMKIGTKLLGSFILVAAIAGLIGWVGLRSTNEMKVRSAATYNDRLVPIRDLGYANAALLIARTEIRNMLFEKDRAKRKEYAALVEDESRKMEAYLAAYSKSNLSRWRR